MDYEEEYASLEEEATEDTYLQEEEAEESTSVAESPAPATRERSARMPRGKTYKFLGMRYTSSSRSVSQMREEKDYNGLITQFFVPLFVVGVGVAWSGRKLVVKYEEQVENLLTKYANEMVFHDGDFEEMEMCHMDYKRRLFSLGPKKSGAMMKRFLEVYAKKKPISPQSVGSLSHVFSMYKLNEDKAAKCLLEVAETCMKDKVASAGKLLFFGSRILKSSDAKKKLSPIRDMLIKSYKKGGEMMVDNAQKTMGEAAYRAAVVAAGKNQTSLTVGWEILGLEEETAQSLFDQVENTGFKSKREELYGGGKQKFDDKGRKVSDEGKISDPKEAAKAKEEDNNDGGAPGTNVYECEECGFTLFPAKGREFKFFPASYTCPECNAPKDKFKKT